ncbi:MAG: coproporphyrinogen III oxidase, partial [Brooklawnia sp.]
YAALLEAGQIPVDDHEFLDDQTRRIERVLLELRLAEGLPIDVLTGTEQARLARFADRGLVVVGQQRVRLTLQGRLLADAVIRDLLD